jgi:uncharacterized membrane protein YphA (DoxX/SURF4 family)
MNIALWIIQILLALLFLFAGGTKIILPVKVLQAMGSPNQIMLPGFLIKFIGLCEVLGALGLILPGLLHKRPSLTPLAAAGLSIIMIGAVALSIAADGVMAGIGPLVVGILCVFVAYGRSRLVPHRESQIGKGVTGAR